MLPGEVILPYKKNLSPIYLFILFYFFFENLLLIFGFIVRGINQEIMKVVPLCKGGVKKTEKQCIHTSYYNMKC